MAGAGSRFAQAGYTKPKPFIDVAGKPMIARVLENLAYPNARFILVGRKEQMEQEAELVKEIEETYNAIFVPVEKLTEGTACTVLYAKKLIDNDTPLMIANSDQIVDLDIGKFIDDCAKRCLDGSILTFIDKEMSPKWSFAKTDAHGLVTDVKEKIVISDRATVGIYFFTQGKDFVDAAIRMIIENDRVNNEFYTCPTFNYMIAEDKKIGIYDIAYEQMHGIGVPEDYSGPRNPDNSLRWCLS
jgi:NDP-sugar pyrophosphorylase family protein